MKTMRRVLLTMSLVSAAGLGLVLFAQIPQARVQSVQTVVSSARALAASEPVAEKTIPLVSTESWSPPGTYWTLQETNYPPLPFDPFPELPVYEIDSINHIYLIDDRSADFEAMQQAAEEQVAMKTAVKTLAVAKAASVGGQMSLMDSGEALACYSSNDLWLGSA